MTTPTTPADVDVVVVGGGIGGLGNALALQRAGQRVRVLERSLEFGEVGAGLQMAPNATRILRDWGVLDQVVAEGVLPRHLVMRDALDGSELTRLDLQQTNERYGAPYVVIHRSDLHRILLDACRESGVDLVTSCTVTEVTDVAGGVEVHSPDRLDRARIAVGADGLGSTLRSVLSDDEQVSSAYVAYRGAVPVDQVAGQQGLAMNDVVVYIGPRRHLVQYPLRHGEIFNQVAVFESSRARRGEQDWGTPDELDAAFEGSCDAVRSALPRLWRDRWWRMYDREPIKDWRRGGLVLSGDAAHPMLQYLAQGACQAIEDAATLATLVTDRTDAPDWDAALDSYVDQRVPRTAEVQTTARWWGEFWHRDGAERESRNAVLRARGTDDFQHLDWLYAAR